MHVYIYMYVCVSLYIYVRIYIYSKFIEHLSARRCSKSFPQQFSFYPRNHFKVVIINKSHFTDDETQAQRG